MRRRQMKTYSPGMPCIAALLALAISHPADAGDVLSATLSHRAVVPIGWDCSGLVSNYNRQYNTSGFDRRFDSRSSPRGYNTSGFDRSFDSRSAPRAYNTRRDRPPCVPYAGH